MAKLTAREARFVIERVKGASLGDAYLACLPDTHPPMTGDNARKAGWRLEKRLREKVDWSLLLDAAGLGLMRLIQEQEKRLTAMKTEFYKGEVVKGADGKPLEVEDNGTRMEATKLLADFHGKRSKLELSGPGGRPIRIVATSADEAL